MVAASRIEQLTREREAEQHRAVTDNEDSALAPVERWIAKHPQITLGLAVSLGVLAGWFVKRR